MYFFKIEPGRIGTLKQVSLAHVPWSRIVQPPKVLGRGLWMRTYYYYSTTTYHGSLPLNLASKKQASKQEATKQHFSFPFWRLLRSTASGSMLF